MTSIWQRIRGRHEPDLTCRELVALVTDYLEGVLPDGERKRFEDHLRECDGCASYLDQIRLTITVVSRIEVDDLSEQMKSDLLASFRGWARS